MLPDLEEAGNESDKLKDGESCAGMKGEDVKKAVNDLDNKSIDSFPLFMPTLPQGDDADSNVPLQALQSLLYEGSPYDQALNFKNQGNECFALGPSGYHDALTFYTRGIGIECGDTRLEATLYLNRAAVHLGLGNWGDVVKDAKRAIDKDPEFAQIKAHKRILRASLRLNKYLQAKESADSLIKLGEKVEEDAMTALEELHQKYIAEEATRKEKEVFYNQVRDCLGELRQKVTVLPGHDSAILNLFGPESSTSSLPTLRRDARTKRRIWPLILLYPSAAQSDFLSEVDESSSFKDLIKTVFASPPEWDRNGEYSNNRNISKLRIFWHDSTRRNVVYEIPHSRTLSDLLGHLIKEIGTGLLCFHVIPPGPASDEFVSRFTLVEKF